jgi:hypothetical protein
MGGSFCQIDDVRHRTNPWHKVARWPWCAAMIAEWELCRPGGLAGASLLPDPGGTQQQSIAMLEAFEVLDLAHRQFTRPAADGEA